MCGAGWAANGSMTSALWFDLHSALKPGRHGQRPGPLVGPAVFWTLDGDDG